MPTASDQVGKTLLTRWVSGLRFPQLFTFTAILLLIDFFVPDMIPFLDEVLLAAATLLLANLKGKTVVESDTKPTEKDITPRD